MTRGLYIHYPFCSKLCNYCDFAVDTRLKLQDSYWQALQKEILHQSSLYEGSKEINSIYIGGGTPSLMPLNHFKELTKMLKELFDYKNDLEFSIEVNPGTVNKDKYEFYLNNGVNRISIGVQSFEKRELGLITRNHSPKAAERAVLEASEAGFQRINLDLMFSLPYQSRETLLNNLEKALSLPIDHISAYSLIYEPGTKLYEDYKSGKIKKHGEEYDAELYEIVIDYLIENNFEQYEVSNFAKNKSYCRHNLSAWSGQEYFAFGLGANGYLNGIRFANTKRLDDYIRLINEKSDAKLETDHINNKKKFEEKIFLGLRSKGIHNSELTIDIFKDDFINELINSNFAKIQNEKIVLTKKGYLFCDTITFKLLNYLSQIETSKG